METGDNDKLILVDNNWENIDSLTPKNKWIGYHYN